MAEKNSVSVKIFGQEYSISGEMPREEIMKLADYVDMKMQEVATYYNGSATRVAVLAGMNLAQEIFAKEDNSKELENLNEKLAQAASYNEVLRARIEELTVQLETTKSVPEESQKLINELEAKCRDIESSFFDIQMENIHLKNELESLKRQMR
jgi:cell division protein ZapA (FtsZ GTPase activity inhibitor)